VLRGSSRERTPSRREVNTARILVTNDDGVFAPGLWAVVDALSDLAEVVVMAPDREQSGIGTAITLHQPLRMMKVSLPSHPDIDTYSVQGTPGDCVILGLQNVLKDGVDLVVSGINDGSNLGNDVLISGTVGGAMQAYFAGIPAIAASVAPLKVSDFSAAARLVHFLASCILSDEISSTVLLNLNIPDLTLSEIQGIEITSLARRTYVDVIEQSEDSRGKVIYWITRGKAVWEEDPGSDIWAIRNNRVSITPLQSDIASREQVDNLQALVPRFKDLLTAPV
jgi:5'-nucleotidase